MKVTYYEKVIAGIIKKEPPARKKRQGFRSQLHEMDGEMYTIDQLAEMSPLGLTRDSVYRRIVRTGMTPKEAITVADVRAWTKENPERKPRQSAA